MPVGGVVQEVTAEPVAAIEANAEVSIAVVDPAIVAHGAAPVTRIPVVET
jgi:hypothetical protein